MQAGEKVLILLLECSCEIFWNPVPLSVAVSCEKRSAMNRLVDDDPEAFGL